MTRKIYINGNYLPIEQAFIPVMDRGFLFGDGVYEVSAVLNGKLIDNDGHLNRLKRSLSELKFPDVNIDKIKQAQIELIKQNNLLEGCVYIQITRGTAERDFNYSDDSKPNIVMFTQVKKITSNPSRDAGVNAITHPDIRWKRCDIKSTALLAQVVAKNEALKQGAFEAIMFDEDGFVTEGSSANVFIVKNNVIITRNLNNQILHGITRKATLKLASEHNLNIEERKFKVEELFTADEVFLTSATNFVIGVVEIDGKTIANGKVGEYTKRLFDYYILSSTT